MLAEYNHKEFLLPESPNSMACYHAKVQGGVMKLTIHDCKGSIQLWNDITSDEGLTEAVNKLRVLEQGIEGLRMYLNEIFERKQSHEHTKNAINN